MIDYMYILESSFARYGISDEVISDNGPRFSRRKCKQFTESWEFKRTQVPSTLKLIDKWENQCHN